MTDSQDLGADIVEQIRPAMVHDEAWRDLENGFEYWIGGHRQTVTSGRPIEEEGFTGWLVTVKTDFLRAKDPERNANISSLGRLAGKLCFSGLAEGDEPGTWQLVSTVFVYNKIASWILRPILQACTHQYSQCFEWPEPMAELEPYFEPLKTNPPGEQDPNLPDELRGYVPTLKSELQEERPFVGEELVKLTESFKRPPCVLCNGSENGMTAEFPFAELTQMLTVIEKYHERLGRGFEIMLRLPCGESLLDTGRMALRLNGMDAATEAGGDLLGSWCTDETHGATLSYYQFIPYAYLQPNLLTNYAYGLTARARWVDGVLNESEWSDSYESAMRNKTASFEQATSAMVDDPEGFLETKDKLFEDSDAADAVFRKLSDFVGVLSEPVEVGGDFFKVLKQVSLFHYGIFNPMGPTWSIFSLARHPKHDFCVLCNRMLNPFEQTYQVLGAFSEEILVQVGFAEIFGQIFRQNGSSENPLLKGLPTWVLVPSDANLAAAWIAFRSYYDQHGDKSLDLDVAHLKKFAGKPWDRASEGFKDLFSGLKGLVPPVTGLLPKSPDDGPVESPPPATFEEWWEIVTSDEHLKSEIPNMILAWKGSIDMQKSLGSSDAFPNVMEFEGFVQVLNESGSSEEIYTRFVKKDGES